MVLTKSPKKGSSPFIKSSKLLRSPILKTQEAGEAKGDDNPAKETPKGPRSRKNSISEVLNDDRGGLTQMEYAVKVAKELNAFVNSKSNIHGDAKILAMKVERAIREAAKEHEMLVERCRADTLRLAKRPRSSPEAVDTPKGLKRPKAKETPSTPAEAAWKVVQPRRRKETVPKAAKEERKAVRQKADAILIGVKEGTQYADVLKMIRKAPDLKELGEAVSRVRQARGGEILLEFKPNSEVKSAEFKAKVESTLGEAATVKALTQQVTLECRNLDAITTAEEVWTALKDQAALEVDQSNKPIRMRKTYGETQAATISLPAKEARKLLELGKVKVGWSVCTIKVVTQLLRCYKCTEYGHHARTCKGVDRSAACWKCGGDGHKAAGCKEAPRCLLCKDGDNNHVAGSSKCGAYKAAMSQKGWK